MTQWLSFNKTVCGFNINKYPAESIKPHIFKTILTCKILQIPTAEFIFFFEFPIILRI